jgi:imidazolonepropionase-like amidohydrolase
MSASSDPGAPRPLHLHGVVVPDDVERDLFVVDGGFAFDLPPGAPEPRPLGGEAGRFLLPGLVDAHAHLAVNALVPPGSPPEAIAEASARQHLAAGVLAIREPASPTVQSAGIGPGAGLPRTVTAGRFLSAPGRYFPGSAVEVAPEDLARAALEQLAASGSWVKVVGDWVDPADGMWRPSFPEDAMVAAARAVHEAGGRIAVHAAEEASIEGAIVAGFDSIEHGLRITRGQLDRMDREGIAFTPTLSVIGLWTELIEMVGSPVSEVERAQRAVDRHPAMVRAAAEAGVRMLAGTDAGVVPHGEVAGEIRRLVDAGVPAAMAVAAGSWDARGFLGFPGIEAGAPADLVTFDADPRLDLGILERPRAIMLAGRFVKEPRPSSGR